MISLEYPLVLTFILPAFLLLLLVLKHEFLKMDLDERMKKKLKRHRLLLLFSRTFIFSLLIIALSSPYIVMDEVVDGNPFISIIVDNTTSYDLFNPHTDIIDKLRDKINVEVSSIDQENQSAIGDAVLDASKNADNLLLLSDGQNNYGSDLSDVSLFLSTQNITLNTIKNRPIRHDVSVSLSGPSETVPDIDNTFYVSIDKDEEIGVILRVFVDGKLKIQKKTYNENEVFQEAFTSGIHEIHVTVEATDGEENYFEINDIYYKVINVIPKPKVLFVTDKGKPLIDILNKMYEVTQVGKLPDKIEDLKSYYSVIINDIPSNEISNDQVDMLENFLDEGNGLVVFGGEESFDYGGYKGNYFETILPTKAGEGKIMDDSKQKVNIVFVIDISYGSYGNEEGIAVAKAHAVNIMNTIRSTDKIGVIAFNSEVYIVSDMVEYDMRRDLIASHIKKLPFGGSSNMGPAIIYATRMLENLEGNNNILVLSDGWTTNCNHKMVRMKSETSSPCKPEDDLAYVANFADNRGITIFSLGVPQDRPTEPVKESIMKKIAEITGGSYDLASRANNIQLEFGKDKERREEERVNIKSLSIKNSGHFITSGLNFESAEISGFNTIVPKSNAQALVTTSQGYPIVTSWRYGLGRVVSYTTDDGRKWAGNLLTKENSKLLSRVFAFSVGNPKRKQDSYIEIPDTEVSQLSDVIVKSESFPINDQLNFNMVEPSIYMANFVPESIGFNILMDRKFAVNYPSEFKYVGMDEMLHSLAMRTGGFLFEPNDIESMVEQAKAKAKNVISRRIYFRWVLIIISLGIFLIELTIRRYLANQRKI